MSVVEYASMSIGQPLRSAGVVLAVWLVKKCYGAMAGQIRLVGFSKIVVDVGAVFVEGVAHFMEYVEAESFAISNKSVGTGYKSAVVWEVACHDELEDGIVDREFEEADAVTHHLVGVNGVVVVIYIV